MDSLSQPLNTHTPPLTRSTFAGTMHTDLHNSHVSLCLSVQLTGFLLKVIHET